MGSSLEHIGTQNQCLNKTPVSQTLRSTVNKQDLLKLRSFCKAKDMVNETNSTPENGKISSTTLHWIEG